MLRSLSEASAFSGRCLLELENLVLRARSEILGSARNTWGGMMEQLGIGIMGLAEEGHFLNKWCKSGTRNQKSSLLCPIIPFFHSDYTTPLRGELNAGSPPEAL